MKLDGHKVLRARELLGYGIVKAAETAGVSKNSILSAEHGREIRPVTARKIAAGLGMRVADLIAEEITDHPKASVPPALQASLFNGDVADVERHFEVEALGAKRHAIRLLSAWRKFIDHTKRRWEASESGPTIGEVRGVLDALESMIETKAFQPAFGGSTDEFAESERFELEMLYKGLDRLRELAEPVVADKDASRARRTFKVLDGLREAS